jgi:hypothetical protein
LLEEDSGDAVGGVGGEIKVEARKAGGSGGRRGFELGVGWHAGAVDELEELGASVGGHE